MLSYDTREAVAWIKLDRPEKLNAMLPKKESCDCIIPPIEIPTIEGGWWQK